MKATIKINITKEIITPESAADGEAAERWIDGEKIEYEFKELVSLLRGTEASTSPKRYITEHTWATQYGSQEPSDGSYENTSYHFADKIDKAKYWIKALQVACR